MNIFTKVSIFALSLVNLGCARLYYPQTSSPVLVEVAGDVQVGIGLSYNEMHSSIAVAPTDNFAFYGSYAKYGKGGYMTDSKIGYSRNINNKYRLGMFVGMSLGAGRVEFDDGLLYENYKVIDGTTELKYVMPQFRIRGLNTDYVLSTKIGVFKQDYHFFNERHSRFDYDKIIIEEPRHLNTFYMEPSFSIIKTIKNVSIVGTASIIPLVVIDSNYNTDAFEVFNGGFSLVYRFNVKK